jgi:regulatory protein
MPVVTAIRQQRRRPDRYSVYLDGKYELSLGEAQLAELSLRVDEQVDAARLSQLQRNSAFSKAIMRAHNLILHRPRSRVELTRYLMGKDDDEELAARVLEEFEREGLIDDARFARQWVEDRRSLGYSTMRLRQELRQKGIATELADSVLTELAGDEVSVVGDLIDRRRLRARYPDDQKLIQHLQGKGFSHATIKAALERLE